MRFDKVIGTGGIGSGIFFQLTDNATLGREESRTGYLTDYRDYCKLHIILSYVGRLIGKKIPVYAVGKVGKDAVGESLLKEMNGAGILSRFVKREEGVPTTYSVCFQYPDKSGCNVTAENGASGTVDAEYIRACLRQAAPDEKTLALAAPEVPLEARRCFIEECAKSGAYVAASFSSEELRGGIDDLLQKVSLLSINMDEAAALAGKERTVEACCKKMAALNARAELIITDGGNGSYAYSGGEVQKFNVIESAVVSTAGAGDSFLGGVIAGKCFGLPLRKAAEDAWFGQTPLATSTELGILASHFAVESADTIPKTFSANEILQWIEEAGICAPLIVKYLKEGNEDESCGSRSASGRY